MMIKNMNHYGGLLLEHLGVFALDLYFFRNLSSLFEVFLVFLEARSQSFIGLLIVVNAASNQQMEWRGVYFAFLYR